MKLGSSNLVTFSIYEWLNSLVIDNDGHVDKECFFQSLPDSSLPDSIKPYSCQFKQIAYNKKVFTNTVLLQSDKGEAPMNEVGYLDHTEGRILVTNPAWQDAEWFSCTLPIREFNLYLIEQKGERISFEGNFLNNFRYAHLEPSPIQPYVHAIPAIFLVETASEVRPFAIGGATESKSSFRAVIVAEDQMSLAACKSVLIEQKNRMVKILRAKDLPLNSFGALKPAYPYGYDYRRVDGSDDRIFIENVRSIPTKNDVLSDVESRMFTAVVDFDISWVRAGGGGSGLRALYNKLNFDFSFSSIDFCWDAVDHFF